MKSLLFVLALAASVIVGSDAQAFGGRCRLFGGRFASGGCGTAASACQPQAQFAPQQAQVAFAAQGCTNCGCQPAAQPGFANPILPAPTLPVPQIMPTASASPPSVHPAVVEWAVPPSVTARSTVYLSGSSPLPAQPASNQHPTIQLSEPVPTFGRPLGVSRYTPMLGGCSGGQCGQPAGFLFR